jgi:response regulator RpfG family c-di-GMP phosphodiesterase
MEKEVYTIALLDDDKDLLALTGGSLRKQGYKVVAYENGVDFLTAIKKGAINPSAIITDVDMPFKSGVETISDLAKFHDLSETPVLFLTGVTDDLTINAAFENNINHIYYMLKPVNYMLLNMTMFKMILSRNYLRSIKSTNKKLVKVIRQLQDEKKNAENKYEHTYEEFLERQKKLIDHLTDIHMELEKFK